MTTDPTSRPPSDQVLRFREGQKLAGCYALKKQIALGDKTEVWLAHDEVLGKDVSLHFLPEVIRKDARVLEELRHEIKRNRQLIHPDILRVYDLIEEPEWAAISMDPFDGQSLASLREKKTDGIFEPREIQPWIAQICQTLADAHKINLVHGDLSLENIFVEPDGKLLLANFGLSRCIVRAVDGSGEEKHPSAGTSPQQKETKSLSKTEDIFGVGALIFRLVTGKLPPKKYDDAQIAKSLQEGSRGSLPPQWEEVILACLAADPAARPATTSEIALRLGRTAEQPKPLTSTRGRETEKPKVEKSALVAANTDPRVSKEVTRKTMAEKEPVSTPSTETKPKPLKSSPAEKVAENATAQDIYPSLYPRRSRFPVTGFAIAVALVGIGIAGYYLTGSKPPETEPNAPELASTDFPAGSELTSVTNNIEPPPAAASAQPPEHGVGNENATGAAILATTPNAPVLLVQAATPIPTAPAKIAPAPTRSQNDQTAVAERTVTDKILALEKARQAVSSSETARQELLKQKQTGEAAVTAAQKILDEKLKTAAPTRKAAEEVLMARKKKEDEQKEAELAAQQAQQLAAEKARTAEDAKKAVVEFNTKNRDKIAAQEKVEAELQALQKSLAHRQRTVADAAKSATEAEAARQQQLAAVKTIEQEVEQAKLAAAEAQRIRDAQEAERRKLDQELAEMQEMFTRKMAEIEARRKSLETPSAKVDPEVGVKPVSPAPVTPPRPPSATPVPPPTRPSADLVPKPTTPEPLQLAMKTEPDKSLSITPVEPVKPPVTPGGTTENSLGMKFVPVGDVAFCIWQTRLKDFEVFGNAVNLRSSAWRAPGFKQAPDHPVVNVTWQEAIAFCKWLTDREHKENQLPPGQYYRLPTDLEWSRAVDLPEESGPTPEARDMAVPDVYPWGTQWPPPSGAGNYTGEETGSDVAIKGYDDGFAWTSPVASFSANKYGLYDMGGNVWQWCMDSWNRESKAKVLRGASWYNGALKLSLLSSCRVHAASDSSTDNYGFRIVRASEPLKMKK